MCDVTAVVKWTEGSGGTILVLGLYFGFALVHDSRGIEIVTFTTAAALSAGTSVRKNVCNNSKNVKSNVFLKSEKNVKNVKKRRPTAYVQFHRPLNHSAFILNYRNQNSVPVPVIHQHHTPCSEIRTQETNMQLTCRSVIVKRLGL